MLFGNGLYFLMFIDGLAQGYGNTIANALELLRSFAKSSIYEGMSYVSFDRLSYVISVIFQY